MALPALLLAANPAHAADFITNGSFEQGTAPGSFTTVNAGGSNITGWTVVSGSVDYIGSYWNAEDGSRSIDLAGNSYGTLSQIVNLVAGQAYQLSFFLSANPDRSVYPRSTNVSIDGMTQQFDYSGSPTKTDMGWLRYTWDFVASTDGPSTLSFTALNTGNAYGPALDNVMLSAVPEPTTWALMIFGFMAVGFSMRRRRNTRVSFA
jgi:choice-of-anchor C domain-containing protein